MIPTNAPLVGFEGSRVFPLGAVTLSVIIDDYPQQIVKDVTFLVVDCLFAYNAILGRPTLNSLVVSLRVEDYNMHQVLVDNGSSVDILYYPVFQQMRINRE